MIKTEINERDNKYTMKRISQNKYFWGERTKIYKLLQD